MISRVVVVIGVVIKVLVMMTLGMIGVEGWLLRDLPTPAFVVDMDSLQRRVDAHSGSKRSPIPPLILPNNKRFLSPTNLNDCPYKFIPNGIPLDTFTCDSTDAIYYFHSSVISSQQEPNILAHIDLKPFQYSSSSLTTTTTSTLATTTTTTTTLLATLVLGLNNHHVGSYYWARSAGTGASMEAPGVCCTNDGILCWESMNGPMECNSNDGKRSEWVTFLLPGDTVQLLPADPEDALFQYLNMVNGNKVYGVSSQGRPLGSEPRVVCEWIIQL